MSSVHVAWKGNCRSAEARTRLLDYLQRLARVSDGYLRPAERRHLTVVADGHVAARANIERVDETRHGEILVSTDITAHPETLLTRAKEAGLPIRSAGEGVQHIVLDEIRLHGIDFRLFDPRGLYPENDRMSFVFIESPLHHFLDGRLVKVKIVGAGKPVDLTVDGIWQDEAVGAEADGVIDGKQVWLRAERDEDGDGRVYHVAFSASYRDGTSCAHDVLVTVPLHRGAAGGVHDDGPLDKSTLP